MRYFWDTEEEKVYSEHDLMSVFCDLMKECPEYQTETFCDFLREASGKNGSLIEIKKPLSADAVEEINAAALEFLNGFERLYRAFADCDVSEDSFNRFLSDEFPFVASLDEMPPVVESWINRVVTFAQCLSRD